MTPQAPQPTSAPEDVLLQALAFQTRLQYDGVVALCDPAPLAQWFYAYRELFRAPTLEEFRASYSHIADEKPPAVLQALRALIVERQSQIPRTVPGTASLEELLALSPEEFARRCLKADDMRCRMVRALRRRSEDVPEEIFAPPPGWEYRVTRTVVLSVYEIRVHYAELYQGEVQRGAEMEEYEELRRLESGEWRLIAHSGLLQSRGATSTVIPQALAELIEE